MPQALYEMPKLINDSRTGTNLSNNGQPFFSDRIPRDNGITSF